MKKQQPIACTIGEANAAIENYIRAVCNLLMLETKVQILLYSNADAKAIVDHVLEEIENFKKAIKPNETSMGL